jgi:hypothetical protein
MPREASSPRVSREPHRDVLCWGRPPGGALRAAGFRDLMLGEPGVDWRRVCAIPGLSARVAGRHHRHIRRPAPVPEFGPS